MCIQGLVAPFIGGAGASAGAAAATGATAAAGIGGALQTAGFALSILAPIVQGQQAAQAYEDQAAALEAQRTEEKRLAAIEDDRTRRRFRSEIRKQSAELAARGVSMDSPTALLLGDTAAREMSFGSQSARSGALAKDRELSASARLSRSRAAGYRLKGFTSGAAAFIDGAPDIWPGLAA